MDGVDRGRPPRLASALDRVVQKPEELGSHQKGLAVRRLAVVLDGLADIFKLVERQGRAEAMAKILESGDSGL